MDNTNHSTWAERQRDQRAAVPEGMDETALFTLTLMLSSDNSDSECPTPTPPRESDGNTTMQY